MGEYAALFSLKALKSKYVLFGILQLLYTAYGAYQAGGGHLPPDAITTLVSGVITILLRPVTTQPLSAK